MKHRTVTELLEKGTTEEIRRAGNAMQDYVAGSSRSAAFRECLKDAFAKSKAHITAGMRRLETARSKPLLKEAFNYRAAYRWVFAETETMVNLQQQILWLGFYLLRLHQVDPDFARRWVGSTKDPGPHFFSLEEMKQLALEAADNAGPGPHDKETRHNWMIGLRGMLRCDEKLEQRIFEDFFSDRSGAEKQDQSYYLVYRHSLGGAVAKSLLAISTPADNAYDYFSFLHAFNHEKKGEPPIRRISSGALLAARGTYYFVGGTMRAINKRTESRTDEASIDHGLSVGCQFIAVPYSGPEAYFHEKLTGLYMSHALDERPIVGRVAMLHLGFRSKLGRELWHDQLDTGILRKEHVAADLRTTLTKVPGSWPAGRLENDVAFILSNINNNPKSQGEGEPGGAPLEHAIFVAERREH